MYGQDIQSNADEEEENPLLFNIRNSVNLMIYRWHSVKLLYQLIQRLLLIRKLTVKRVEDKEYVIFKDGGLV